MQRRAAHVAVARTGKHGDGGLDSARQPNGNALARADAISLPSRPQDNPRRRSARDRSGGGTDRAQQMRAARAAYVRPPPYRSFDRANGQLQCAARSGRCSAASGSCCSSSRLHLADCGQQPWCQTLIAVDLGVQPTRPPAGTVRHHERGAAIRRQPLCYASGYDHPPPSASQWSSSTATMSRWGIVTVTWRDERSSTASMPCTIMPRTGTRLLLPEH